MRSLMAFFALVLVTLAFSCKSSHSDPAPDTTASIQDEPFQSQITVIENVNSTASSAEGVAPQPPTVLKRSLKRLTGRAPKLATSCPTQFPACVSGISTVTFSSCTDSDQSGDSLTLNGSYTAEVMTVSGSAPDNTACNNMITGGSVLPSGDIASVIPQVTVVVNSFAGAQEFDGMKLVADSNPTAWDGTSFPNASQGMSVTNTGSSHVLTINGSREEILGANGAVWINISSMGQLTATGTLAGGNRVIQNGGVITAWDNVKHVKVVHTFGVDGGGNPVSWTDPTCCYPTEGQLTSVYSGAVSGASTLTFTSTCGSATWTPASGPPQTLDMGSC